MNLIKCGTNYARIKPFSDGPCCLYAQWRFGVVLLQLRKRSLLKNKHNREKQSKTRNQWGLIISSHPRSLFHVEQKQASFFKSIWFLSSLAVVLASVPHSPFRSIRSLVSVFAFEMASMDSPNPKQYNYNLNNPSIKRIMKEMKEMDRETNSQFSAAPLEVHTFHITILLIRIMQMNWWRLFSRKTLLSQL